MSDIILLVVYSVWLVGAMFVGGVYVAASNSPRSRWWILLVMLWPLGLFVFLLLLPLILGYELGKRINS